MRNPRVWSLLLLAMFGIYLISLAAFVRRQMEEQAENISWRRELNGRGFSSIELSAAGQVYVFSQGGKATAFSSNGESIWETETGGDASLMNLNDHLLLPDGGFLVIETDARDLAQQIAQLQGQPPGGSVQLPAPKILLVGPDGRLGKEIPVPFRFKSSSGLQLAGEKLVLEDDKGLLRAIDLDGNELWHSSTQGGSLRVPGPAEGLLVLSVNSISNTSELALLDNFGSQKWYKQLPGDYGSGLQSDGERIWYVDAAGELRCMDGDGNELWTYASPVPFITGDPLQLQYVMQWQDPATTLYVDGEGRSAVLDVNGLLHLLDRDGQLQEQIELGHSGTTRFAVDFRHGRIVVVDGNGLRVLDLGGKLLQENEYVESSRSPLLDRQRGLAYVLQNDSLSCIEY